MIENLYDSVLSITQETGYLERILRTHYPNPLRWSENKNLIQDISLTQIEYPVIAFSHDEFFYTPAQLVIN